MSQNGYVVADLPSERGKVTKKHYLRYTDDPILTDTESKQSTKLSSRIGKVKSWRPPKSFLPVAGSLTLSNMRRRMTTSGGENHPAPVKREEGFDSRKSEGKIEYEFSKQIVSDYSQHKSWKHILKGFSALKSETNEEKDAKQDAPTVQSRRFSCNSAGSEVVW